MQSNQEKQDDISKISDDDLIREFRKRFIVFQWFSKDFFEELFNEGEEIPEKKYKEFKEWIECKYNYTTIEEDTELLWEEFNEKHNSIQTNEETNIL